MNTRMDKYKEETSTKRVDKNKSIYTSIDEKDIEDLNLTSNISILDADTTNLDINALKAMLDERYTKKKLANLEDEQEEKEDLEITREYDLNKALDKVRSEHGADYIENRHRKRHESEYEILNSLNLKRTSEPEKIESITPEEATLINLIKTINENELKHEIVDDIGLLDNLKGNDNTEVLDPIILDEDNNLNKPTIVEELEKTKKLSKTDILNGLEETVDNPIEKESDEKEDAEEVPSKETLENTFYTGKLTIKDNDLNDFADLENSMSNSSALVKILILLGILVVLGIIVVILNKYLNLGLF